MITSRRTIGDVFLVTALLCSACLAQGAHSDTSYRRGVIEGKVVNEKSQPVAQAQVWVSNGQPTIGAERYVETDGAGRYRIDRLEWGTYSVYGQKESAGYPDMSFGFYHTFGAPKAVISGASPVASVTVRIGPPCAKLQLQSITDAATGQPVRAAVTLRRASDPHNFLTITTSSGPILVPSDTGIFIEILAEGYKPWPPESDESAGKISLKPGQLFILRAVLQPIKSVVSR